MPANHDDYPTNEFATPGAPMKTALVHDWLTTPAGSEQVLGAIAALYPGAPIHTLVHTPTNFRGQPWDGREIHTSFLQRLPLAQRHYQKLLPLFPLAIESFNFDGFDTVISSSHAVAKGVITRADQLHLSYVYTPIRYAWDMRGQYLGQTGLNRGVKGVAVSLILHYLRQWDVATANRVDAFVATSRYIARRIWKTYRRPSRVIYPPVDLDRFKPSDKREPFYLTVSRLVPYKYVDRIVDAFTRMNLPLVVIGDGPERERVERAAGPSVTVLGRQSDEVVRDHLSRCRAFVFMADEDFGIAPVEAQASGAPVIAFGRGGSLETVAGGKTGVFFNEQTSDSLRDAVARFEREAGAFRIEDMIEHSQRFSRPRFDREFTAFVGEMTERFRAGKSLDES